MRRSQTSRRCHNRSLNDLVAWGNDGATYGFEPGQAVEFGVDGRDLPGIHASSVVRSCEMSDAVDSFVGTAEVCVPAEGDVLAVECINCQDDERNRWLSALSCLESSLARERRPTERETLEGEDGVGVVDQVVRQKLLSIGSGVGDNKPLEAGGKVRGSVGVQALGWVTLSSPETAMAPWNGSDRSDEGGRSRDGG